MASRNLFKRIIPFARPPVQQQSRSIQYTTKFAIDRKAVKDHAHHTAGTPSPQTILTFRSLAKSNNLVPASIISHD